MVDLTSFEKALETLQRALLAHEKNPDDEFIRDSCIQRFEYCYDFSHKLLRRYLKEIAPMSIEVDELSYPDLIRLGWEKEVLKSEWKIWKKFREKRNITSHTYNEAEAQEVMSVIPEFYREALAFVAEVKKEQGHKP